MKTYEQFISEDIRSKKISSSVDTLERLYPDIRLRYTDYSKIYISCNKRLDLNKVFYGTLKKDRINKEDIIFENCKEINLYNINRFTKISDYGVFGENIKDFYCTNLTTLEGAPEIVGGNFSCGGCENLIGVEI